MTAVGLHNYICGRQVEFKSYWLDTWLIWGQCALVTTACDKLLKSFVYNTPRSPKAIDKGQRIMQLSKFLKKRSLETT